jgi:hypothetical protein
MLPSKIPARSWLVDPSHLSLDVVARVSEAIPGKALARGPGCRFAHPGYGTALYRPSASRSMSRPDRSSPCMLA